MRETLVIDASIAVKWVVGEDGSDAAIGLRARYAFAAPDLLVAECANILWKKTRRNDLSRDEAVLAARLLTRAGIELLPMRGLMEEATVLAIELGHPPMIASIWHWPARRAGASSRQMIGCCGSWRKTRQRGWRGWQFRWARWMTPVHDRHFPALRERPD